MKTSMKKKPRAVTRKAIEVTKKTTTRSLNENSVLVSHSNSNTKPHRWTSCSPPFTTQETILTKRLLTRPVFGYLLLMPHNS